MNENYQIKWATLSNFCLTLRGFKDNFNSIVFENDIGTFCQVDPTR